MWKASAGHSVSIDTAGDDDDWETDADFVVCTIKCVCACLFVTFLGCLLCLYFITLTIKVAKCKQKRK